MGYYMALNAHKIVDPQVLESETNSEEAHTERLQLTETEIAELNAA